MFYIIIIWYNQSLNFLTSGSTNKLRYWDTRNPVFLYANGPCKPYDKVRNSSNVSEYDWLLQTLLKWYTHTTYNDKQTKTAMQLCKLEPIWKWHMIKVYDKKGTE